MAGDDSQPPSVLVVVSFDILVSSVLKHPLSKANTRSAVPMYDRSSSGADILLGSMSSGTSTMAG